MPTVISFFTALICTFILDMIWLGLIAKNLYAENIGMLLKKSGEAMAPNWISAFVVYIAIAIGITYFVLPKANDNYFLAFAWGALFGAVTYGIYDFTNLAILANWGLKISLIDFAWGTFLCGTSSLIAFSVTKWFYS